MHTHIEKKNRNVYEKQNKTKYEYKKGKRMKTEIFLNYKYNHVVDISFHAAAPSNLIQIP